MTGNREYKSDVFSLLLEDKTNAMDVYNALNNTHYDNPDEVEMIRLESFIALSMRNDAAFIIGTDMNLYEHQSTYNPNMPLRGLIYYVDTMEKRIKELNYNIYGRRIVKIPTPRFVVFYNGTEKRPPVEVMRFSDAFMKHTKQPELEVTCMVYNLNAEENRELLKKSRTLYGYTVYVEKVRNLKGTGLPLAQAIDRAIEECIEENVLSEFFRTRRNEVEKVTQLDFTWERQEELLKLEYLEEGRAEGQELTLIRQIVKKLHKNKSPEQIAEDLEEDIPKIRHICEVAERFAPEYDVEMVYQALKQ